MSIQKDDNNKNRSSFNFTDKSKSINNPEDSNISLNPDTRLPDRILPRGSGQITLRKINYYNQLTNLEKMKTQTACMQGIIRGYALYDLPMFIKAKTKIELSIPVVEQIIKIQNSEDRKWYYHMAKDNIAYVSTYRKAITAIEEYQREIWLLTIDKKSDNDTKLNCYKELHSLTKTLVLLLRDLPFITQLSKYYDIDKLTENYIKNNPQPQRENIINQVESPHMGYNPIRRLGNNQRSLRTKDESGLYINNEGYTSNKSILQNDKKSQFDNLNVNLAYQILNDIKQNNIFHAKGNNPNKLEPKKVTDEVMESMQKQMEEIGATIEDKDDLRKLQEQAAVEHHLSKIEDEINNLGGIDNIPNSEKLSEILQKYESSLSFLESFMTEEQKNAIRTVRKLKQD